MSKRFNGRIQGLRAAPLVLCLVWMSTAPRAAEWADCWKAYLGGQYSEAIKMAEEGAKAQKRVEDWRLILIRANLITGNLEAAQKALEKAVDDFSVSGLRIRIAGHEVATATGNKELARGMLQDLGSMAGPRTRDNATNLVAIGQAAIQMSIEPRLVLENFFNQAKRRAPEYREVYLAGGHLALDKSDFAMAADWFREGLSKNPGDPDLNHGLAKALSSGNRSKMAKPLTEALEANPNHILSLLLTADHAIDAEQYAEAEKFLEKAIAVHPRHPDAWAYRAVLAFLRNDSEAEQKARQTALSQWKTNPRVDYLIGLKLSQKYRFKEGSEHQRQALAFDEDYLPSQLQLAQDLLRLGNAKEGWDLAEAVHKKDGYQVTAYNLTSLRDAMQKFKVLTNAHFEVRMTAHEADVYGDRLLALLENSRNKLVEKYGVALEDPTYIEVFNDSKDFAVRTFGMPDNPGFLGVCFGRVVTANSPATTTANPANWEAVIWHEFCHVITLTMTRNRMPRWLSEGISVYEERQANPTWGHAIDLKFRDMILEGELSPIGKMSSAFLTPESNEHLQFAYFQAGLVVDFLIKRSGFTKLKELLNDLREGKEINPAIEARFGSLKELEDAFEKHAKDLAKKLAPDLDTSKPGFSRLGGDREAWETLHPKNYYVLVQKAQKLVESKQWDQAKIELEKILNLYKGPTGGALPQALQARVHRALKDIEGERKMLEQIVAMESDAVDALRRLMEIAESAKDWEGLRRFAEQHLAIDPLSAAPYLALGRAAEILKDAPAALLALQTALKLDPSRPAETHYNIARLLHEKKDPRARRHVLMALEEAPRYLEAHKLLALISRDPAP